VTKYESSSVPSNHEIHLRMSVNWAWRG